MAIVTTALIGRRRHRDGLARLASQALAVAVVTLGTVVLPAPVAHADDPVGEAISLMSNTTPVDIATVGATAYVVNRRRPSR